MKKFFESVYFNVVLALLAAILIIMQEVWIGTDMEWLNSFLYGSAAAFGFSWAAQVIKYLVFETKFAWKHVWIGTGAGVIAALIVALITA